MTADDAARAQDFHRLYEAERILGQLSYYQDRRQEYVRANRQAIIVRNLLLFAAAAAGLASQLVEAGARAGCAVAGAVLGGLAAAVTAYAALIGFPQLEKLYSDAELNLREAAIDWRDLDPDDDHTREVERVEGIFRSEIGQWGQLIVKDAAAEAPHPEGHEGAPARPEPPG